jgi:hypothetical protein
VLLLVRQLGGVAEGVAAMVVADAIVVLGTSLSQPQEGTDRVRSLCQLLEQGAPIRLARGLCCDLSLATSEHRWLFPRTNPWTDAAAKGI